MSIVYQNEFQIAKHNRKGILVKLSNRNDAVAILFISEPI